MGLLKAPQVQMLRDAGRSTRTDVSSALRPVDPDRKQIQNKSIVFYISNESKGVEPALAEQLKIIPLGGLNEIGKNMTVYEYGGEIIVVDCGMAFPGDDMYGIDCVIPDVSYLVKHKNRIRGMFITHGHEDHIGAVPYILKKVNIPIYCTRLTAGLIRLKLEEHGLLKSTKIVTVESGMTVKAGKFSVEFIHVNHSIADSVAFAIHTGLGTVVHTGDFKIDVTPIQGEMIDLARLAMARGPEARESIERLKRENLALQAERAELLASAGLPADYTDEIYSCPICRDTGLDGTELCSCLKKLYKRELTQELSGLLHGGQESFESFDLGWYDALPDPCTGESPRECMAKSEAKRA
mgnify:CR=1 FL=1